MNFGGSMARDRMARIALTLLAATTLALGAPCRADDAAGDSPAATNPAAPAPEGAGQLPAAAGATPPVRHSHQPKHLTVAQSIDASVHRLTLSLDLTPDQQQTLRQILVEQHHRIAKLRGAGAAAPTDVTATTLAIYDQTKSRIRAMLNEEQKRKYVADVPRGELAPAQADLKHWMELEESKRRQDLTDAAPK
jgi:hypothetical protein